MITYVEAETKSRRTSGVIPLHGEVGFNGMRKAGRLTAEALDLLVDAVKPGVTTRASIDLAFEFARDHGAIRRRCSTGLSQVDLHLDQPRRLPRHPRRQAAARGRHRQHRLHADRRRLARRFSRMYAVGDICAGQGRAADRSHL
jgi:hypothetical protein